MNDDVLNISFDDISPGSSDFVQPTVEGRSFIPASYGKDSANHQFHDSENCKINAQLSFMVEDPSIIDSGLYSKPLGRRTADDNKFEWKKETQFIARDKGSSLETDTLWHHTNLALEKLTQTQKDSDDPDDCTEHNEQLLEILQTIDSFSARRDERLRALQCLKQEEASYIQQHQEKKTKIKSNDNRITLYESRLTSLVAVGNSMDSEAAEDVAKIKQMPKERWRVYALNTTQSPLVQDDSIVNDAHGILQQFDNEIDKANLRLYEITQNHNQLTQRIHEAWNTGSIRHLHQLYSPSGVSPDPTSPFHRQEGLAMKQDDVAVSISSTRELVKLMFELKSLVECQSIHDYEAFDVDQKITTAKGKLHQYKLYRLQRLVELSELFARLDAENAQLLDEIKKRNQRVDQQNTQDQDLPPPLAPTTP